jgi:uncharacterized protein with HEPN domain
LLEIIGEAANALSAEVRATPPEVDWRHIVRLRHLLAHHDHRVDSNQIGTIASKDIPELIAHLSDTDP